jgi:hypothetical protein
VTRQPEDGQPPPVRPLEWMTLVRDHPDRPPPDQRYVLGCLALRLDWDTNGKHVPGHGFASVGQLVKDSGHGERTVRRATEWAREHDMLDRLTRGHHLGPGAATNSEWRLRRPSQPATGNGLDDSQPVTADGLDSSPQPANRDTPTGQSRHPNRSVEQHYPRPDHPRPDHPSARTRDPADLIIRAVYPSATDDEIEIIIKDRIARGARSAAAVLAHEADQGTLRLPCDQGGPGRHSDACRDGDSSRCGMDWCNCRCHTQPGRAGPR